MPALSLVEQLGAPAAIAMVLVLFGALYIACLAVDRRRNGTVTRLGRNGRLVTGPWPLMAGAVALAVVNISTLMASVASGSVHGFAWILFAMPGNAIGARLRPSFGLD
jgi:hypothetical protein